MRAIEMLREFFDIECDTMRESDEIALEDAIERVRTMRIAYEINVETRACERAQERYNALSK